MYPEIPIQAKVRLLPYLLLVVVVLFTIDDLSATAQADKSTHRPIAPSTRAQADIPARYLRLYQTAGGRYGIPWAVLAGIGKIESDHGRSPLPGVRSGVNRFGCCAGPMQFNIRNGPRTTWDRWGHGSPYRPEDAIPAAARMLAGNGGHRNLNQAIYSYNHSWAYVAQVRALARRYQKAHP